MHYTLLVDIDASPTSDWYGGKGFDPIGDESTPFSGSFNGNGNEIKNLTINRSDKSYVGLFGKLAGSVKNLQLNNVNIAGTMARTNDWKICVGGFVGFVDSTGTIDDAHVTGTVSSGGDVYVRTGGFAGKNNGTINKAYATGTVSSTGSTVIVGGFTGSNNHGTINNAYAISTISAEGSAFVYVGGFAGFNAHDTINNVYATGTVSGIGKAVYTGAFMLIHYSTKVNNSYAGSSGNFAVYTTNGARMSSNIIASGKRTLAQLQCPTGPGQTCEGATTYTGWSTDVWDFGTSSEMPVFRTGK